MLDEHLAAKMHEWLDLAIENELRRSDLLKLEHMLVMDSAAHLATVNRASENLTKAKMAEAWRTGSGR